MLDDVRAILRFLITANDRMDRIMANQADIMTKLDTLAADIEREVEQAKEAGASAATFDAIAARLDTMSATLRSDDAPTQPMEPTPTDPTDPTPADPTEPVEPTAPNA